MPLTGVLHIGGGWGGSQGMAKVDISLASLASSVRAGHTCFWGWRLSQRGQVLGDALRH